MDLAVRLVEVSMLSRLDLARVTGDDLYRHLGTLWLQTAVTTYRISTVAWMSPAQRILDWSILVGVTVLVGAMLRVDLVWVDSVPAGGDATAHVLWADEMRRVLGEGRLSTWSWDWFAGFPAGRFYYPVPAVLIAVLSGVMPFLVAFKVVLVAGAMLLPVAVFVFFRGVGAQWPVPGVGALLMVPFLLYERSPLVFGGNLASVLAGEFAYSLAISVGLSGLGMLGLWLRDGRSWSWLAVVALTLSLMSHLLVGIWMLVMAGVMVWVLGQRRVNELVVLAAPVLVAGVWLVPLVWELSSVTDPGFPASEPVALVVGSLWWMLLLALAGVVWSVVRRDRVGWIAGGWLAAAGLVVLLMPSGLVVSNSRLLPFWDLGLALSAAVVVGGAVQVWKASRPSEYLMIGGLLVAIVGGVVASAAVRGRAEVLMEGLEAQPAWSEIVGIRDALEDESGRVVWEVFPGLVGYGSPFALQLLPYWSDGRLASLDGLHRESSATSPAVERLLSELSAIGRRSMTNVVYGSLDDFAQGVEHMQLFGVRWYLAASAAAKERADAHPNLTLFDEVAAAPEGGVANWSIFEVGGSSRVEGLVTPPLVEPGSDWRALSDEWMIESGWPDRLEAADGPDDWPSSGFEEGEEYPGVRAFGVEMSQDTVRFEVSRTGVPVLVKASHSPGWALASGDGPYRVTPNLMVVIPDETEVTLTHGPTDADRVGAGVSLLGLAALVALVVSQIRAQRRQQERTSH